MNAALNRAFADQAVHCDALGSPFMGRLMRLCAERLENTGPVANALFAFSGDLGPGGHSVPLRFAGALHKLVLSGQAPEISAKWPPHAASDDDIWQAVQMAMSQHQPDLLRSVALPPQTNEIRRSAALIPALHLVAHVTGLPLILSELGASAGLNLLCDHFALQAGPTHFGPPQSQVQLTPEWRGQTPQHARLQIQERQGVDLAPFDMSQPNEQERLLSYLWPDQPDRLRNTKAALALADQVKPTVTAGDAIAWLEQRLSIAHAAAAHVIYHTVAWQYFPAELQARGEELLQNAGQRATKSAPLARFSMENDGALAGAKLTLQIWPEGYEFDLGRADFHGRWVDWIAPAI